MTHEAEVDIAVVGGGIAGVYCALQRARLTTVEKRPLHLGGELVAPAALHPVPVHLYESSGGLGGRIETWTVRFTPEPFGVRTVEHPYHNAAATEAATGENFRAEFGPMRIEPRDQPLLKNLLDHLGIVEPS